MANSVSSFAVAALFLLAAMLPSSHRNPEARGNSRHYSKEDLLRLRYANLIQCLQKLEVNKLTSNFVQILDE